MSGVGLGPLMILLSVHHSTFSTGYPDTGHRRRTSRLVMPVTFTSPRVIGLPFNDIMPYIENSRLTEGLVTINVNPGAVPDTGHCVGGHTRVLAPVPGVNTRDVEMTDNLATWTVILAHHQPANITLYQEKRTFISG